MIILKNVYPGSVDEGDPNFPSGKFKNETTPEVSNDGTPLEEVWQNDMLGGLLAVLGAAGLSPSGTPDTPAASQLLAGIANIQYVQTVDYQVGARTLHSGVWYQATAANGPGSSVVIPAVGSSAWASDDQIRFDGLYPVGTVYHNGTVGTNPRLLLAGAGHSTWQEIPGRVLVGNGLYQDSSGETRQFTNGQNGGAYKHLLTIPEMPAHKHLMFGAADGNLSNPIDSGNDIVTKRGVEGGSINEYYRLSKDLASTTPTLGKTNNQGGNVAHNNMQPYRVVYQWIRTA